MTEVGTGSSGAARIRGDAGAERVRPRHGENRSGRGRFARWLTSEVLLPANERLMGRSTMATLRDLLAARRLSSDGVRHLQGRKLRALLVHAATHTAWYRDAMRRIGCDPVVDDPWTILAAMPCVTKRDLQTGLDRFVSSVAKGLVKRKTSGSSGEPLTFYLDADRIAADRAARFRAQLDWGIGLADRKAWLWGRPAAPTWTDRVKDLRDRVLGERTLSAYDMGEGELLDHVRTLIEWRPQAVTCYPTAGWRLCQFVLDRGLDLRSAGVAVWFTTGEMLQERHREVIELASGGQVANEYGLREAGFVAHQCPYGTMHVTAESVIVETVRPDGSAAGSAIGEIVVTNLDNLGMPLVRYRTRDFGRIGEARCGCGWATQSLTELAGRQSDFLIASDGTPVVAFALSRRFWDVRGVVQFRVVQESLQSTRVLVVPGAQFDGASRNTIESMIREVLGSGVEVRIEVVDALRPEPSGKTGYIQSRVAGDYL